MLREPGTCVFGMFARHWTPGRVKTRLAAAVGAEQAAAIHRALVETLLARFAGAADGRILAFDPPHCAHDFRATAGGQWRLLPQEPGDLGVRMAAFFAAAFRSGERVVLIGSDSPDLPAEFIAEAFSALATNDIVLGPSADGGYYLVGAARRVPPIFDGIAWSTPDVWPQTVARLRSIHCRWRQLPQWYDVDTGNDLQRLMSRLAESPPADPHLAALAQRLSDLLRVPPE